MRTRFRFASACCCRFKRLGRHARAGLQHDEGSRACRFRPGNPDILLIAADEGSTPGHVCGSRAFASRAGRRDHRRPAVRAGDDRVAPVARDRDVPVISFSTDRKVAGDGVYLLSFLAGDEVHRVIAYAAAQGHAAFAALVPETSMATAVGAIFSRTT